MPAPKGNKFAIGNSGREKKFSSPKSLQNKIDKYFDECDNYTVQKVSAGAVVDVISPKPYTVEGLCMVLDCDRLTLLNYEKTEGYEDYFNTIKRAKLKIQENKVVRAHWGAAPHQFVQFDLINNHGYTSPTKNVDMTTGGEQLPSAVQVSPSQAKEISDSLEDDC
jgi:hypothetical protein